jgi:hypothetical protein
VSTFEFGNEVARTSDDKPLWALESVMNTATRQDKEFQLGDKLLRHIHAGADFPICKNAVPHKANECQPRPGYLPLVQWFSSTMQADTDDTGNTYRGITVDLRTETSHYWTEEVMENSYIGKNIGVYICPSFGFRGKKPNGVGVRSALLDSGEEGMDLEYNSDQLNVVALTEGRAHAECDGENVSLINTPPMNALKIIASCVSIAAGIATENPLAVVAGCINVMAELSTYNPSQATAQAFVSGGWRVSPDLQPPTGLLPGDWTTERHEHGTTEQPKPMSYTGMTFTVGNVYFGNIAMGTAVTYNGVYSGYWSDHGRVLAHAKYFVTSGYFTDSSVTVRGRWDF